MPGLARQPLDAAALRPVADQHDLGAPVRADAAEDVDDGVEALHRAEVRDVEQQAVVAIGRADAGPQRRVRHRRVAAAVEEVGDDHDRRGQPQVPVGVVAQALGDRRHAIRLLDAEGNGLAIGRIGADEGDVGAVQRGHDLGHRGAVRGEDLPGQVGAGGVRHGVVRVDDVERVGARHVDDLGRQREHVLRLAEERVGRRVDGVDDDRPARVAQPERDLAAEDVDLVPAPRQAAGQLGGHDAAAAHRGVADDADAHPLAARRRGRDATPLTHLASPRRPAWS